MVLVAMDGNHKLITGLLLQIKTYKEILRFFLLCCGKKTHLNKQKPLNYFIAINEAIIG